ncbi:putative protein kinase [Aspergillus niger CBS 101883]|uniref:Contig An11c0270, genomic contig n=3 Tax=Aspergillus niger TaxID=5061 RepID=A2QX50_ASPNC|nr:kinase-like protein [Aspergillus niger CBS 101883]XP_059604309.1 uncharacterized protein An11g07640 [Aspergillus niger]PYH61810.1 kinase-like protein [Aspergillus niger CBS 101883]RDH16433.1 kinase-like protein [Aspergillus niger ATCC 13496]CAK45958.1 unnamed protein product [Aspergillus niger]
MKHRGYVTLKTFINSVSMGKYLDDEIQMYKRIERGSGFHTGRNAVRRLLDSFDIDGPEGRHRCLVHPPLWESVLTILHRNPVRRLPAPVLAFVLKRVFLALDYLHTEGQAIHTDIKADNISMFGIEDDSVFHDFTENELKNPCPRKELDGRNIYVSREIGMARELGAPILCDFGSAVPGDIEHSEDIQPDIYRAPEVILEAPWGYKVDIWNVGCMAYRSRAHFAEIIRLLGPPPPELLAKGRLRHKFFSDDGDFLAQSLLGDRIPLEDRETSFKGLNKTRFLVFVRKMLQWDPNKRSSAKELLEDEWICENTR